MLVRRSQSATGGAIFGAVFMMTDPVTNPTCASGRILFAMGCAILTIIIRLKANLPEGVLYSILLMNMMTPTIEKFMDGKQSKQLISNITTISIVFFFGVVSVVLCSFANNSVSDETVSNSIVSEVSVTNIIDFETTISNVIVSERI